MRGAGVKGRGIDGHVQTSPVLALL
ncbi:MAG: hypothetical protein JWQ56_3936, partial [Pseudarthrobacter sp.]|nr:hypothetical protein [Pseudarthrobacter sp.]